MNKRGQEYTLAIAMEYVLLILIAAMLAMFVYKSPHEERINELKAVDLSLALEAVGSTKEDIYLNFDLGKGMNVGIENNKIRVYKKNEEKAGEYIFVRNLNYEYDDLLERKYEGLSIRKGGNLIKIEGR